MQYRKLNELKKLPNNPRIIRDKQFKTLCDSIRDCILQRMHDAFPNIEIKRLP